ncbi:lysylphosphatidylglycerol synthase domain-containing protein [Longivirga aurantiaca]|uniref:Lysylphosphatidylglycerol synthase domain-containing protein n=1 Tax=Longivirga aurantiaca TaxID=1837743 RepID=A0ABW1SVI6_9ACTN
MSGTTEHGGDSTVDPATTPRAVGRLDPRVWRRGAGQLWSSAADAPLERRPTDVVLMVVTVVTLALLSVPAPGPGTVDNAVTQLLDALPGLLGWFWETAYTLALGWALLLVVLAAFGRSRRRLLLVQLVAAILALGIATALAYAEGGTWSGVWDALTSQDTGRIYPAVRLSLVVAIVAVSSPHLARPYRRLGWLLVSFGAVAGVALEIDLLVGAIAGVVLGVAAASAVHVAFGSPGGRVPLELVVDELEDLGVHVRELEHAPTDRRGVVTATGTDDSGRRILVRIYGRDAFEGSLIASAWSRLLYKDGAPATSVGRQTQVEHEAFLTLYAERAGVPVQPVLAAGTAWGKDALLVRRDDGRALPDLARDEVTDEMLHGFWAALTSLHAAGVAHGQVRPHALVVREDGTEALSDLASGTSSPDANDVVADNAQMLVCTATVTDVETAVRVAKAALPHDDLVGLMPFLQPAALDAETKTATKAAEWKMAELRAAVAEATGVEEPPLEKLQRVTIASVFMIVVLGFVAWSVISAVAGIGIDTLIAEFKGADWSWVLVAILIAPFIQVGQAIATLGASMARLRFMPVLGLQYAISFLGLAVPGSAAKIALTIRHLQLVGSNPTAAVAISVINTLGGLLVQVLVIVLTLLTGLVVLTPSSPSSGSTSTVGGALASVNWTLVLIVLVVLIVLAVLLYLAVPKVRRFVQDRAADSIDALKVLRSPTKLLLILFGSVLWNVIAAMALGASLRAFDQTATFAELILINTLVSLFAGLMPIPGNIGVSEAALTAGLTAVGIPQSAALSAAIVYRIATFYVPPLYGAVALKGMRKRGYL